MHFFSSVISAPLCLHSQDARPILTPKPPATAKINGPTIYGARPGHPFLYRIPCTGVRPIQFAAKDLPPSLTLDPATGILTGTTPGKPGTYPVTLLASNARGKSSRLFRIVVGDTLALTPPMGWNTWYSDYGNPTAAKVRQAADAMISSGMADFGYQYVNVDDGWPMKPGSTEPELSGAPRDPQGVIRPNDRFKDMAALAAYIHAKGLKAGLYSSPGPLNCAGYTGSYQHEELDAKTLPRGSSTSSNTTGAPTVKIAPKNPTIADYRKPYDLMGGLLNNQDRDIVLNLCQYGMGDVWTWAPDSGGHSWRTTGDLGDEKRKRLPGFYYIALANAAHASYAGPGHWNDPDYILIGAIDDPAKYDQPQTPCASRSPPTSSTAICPCGR